MAEQHTPKGNVQAALDELRDTHSQMRKVVVDGLVVPFITLGDGLKLESLKPIIDEYLDRPERMRGFAQLTDIESLAAYVNRFKRGETLVFLDDSDPRAPRIEVVFDAHEAEPQVPVDASKGAPARAGWHEFGARYNFPLTPEWKAWRDVASKWLDQRSFASFIEEHVLEIADPTDPGERATAIASELGLTLAGKGKLYELSRGLAVNVNQSVKNTVNLSTGEGQVFFEEKHVGQGGEMLRVPGAFCVTVPVFRGGTAYRMIVMLRYRTQSGDEKKIQWQLAPHLIDAVFEDALEGAAAQLREKTACPVLRGRSGTISDD
jgi:uncharacterized protein YfdQ (DUF2303 family)